MAWSDLKLKFKIPSLIVGFALIGMVAVATASALQARGALSELALERLDAAASARASELGRYLSSIEADLRTMASDPATVEAIDAFDTAFSALAERGDVTAQLKQAYITNNPNPLGEKHRLNAAPGGRSTIRFTPGTTRGFARSWKPRDITTSSCSTPKAI